MRNLLIGTLHKVIVYICYSEFCSTAFNSTNNIVQLFFQKVCSKGALYIWLNLKFRTKVWKKINKKIVYEFQSENESLNWMLKSSYNSIWAGQNSDKIVI